jgi:uncharacterized protein (TIGR02466 family)
MAIKSYFATQIYYDDLLKRNLKKFNQELQYESLQIREDDRAGQKWSEKNYNGGYTSYSSVNQLYQISPTFDELRIKIDLHVKKFIQSLEMDFQNRTFSMTDCWVNIMPAGVAHHSHIHPLSFISGTYYVATPKNAGAISFEDPRLTQMMKAPPKKLSCRAENKQFISYTPEAGKLILFESWLRHEVPASNNQEERISVSFNYDWS